MKCTNWFTVGSVRGRWRIAALIAAHSAVGKIARHSPSHLVTTAPSLKRARNLTGMASRPFSSRLWANSPAKKLSKYPSSV